MRRSVRFLSVAALVAAPMVVGVAAPAGAGSTASVVVRSHLVRPAAVPNTDIAGKGANAKFKPGRLRAQDFDVCGGVSSFTVTNTTTNRTYDVTFNGTTVLTLAPQTSGGLCVSPAARGTIQLGITGSAHLLTVRLAP